MARVRGPVRRSPVAIYPFHAPSQQDSRSVTGPYGITRHRQTADFANDPKDSLDNPKLSKDRPDARKHPSNLKASHLTGKPGQIYTALWS